ncbi:MAG: DEAD/DEAH box helicase family protein [Acidobacteria bacterium]|nr:DEAD/DEAH box helicase family protein [Acidobacteriota bacterium]
MPKQVVIENPVINPPFEEPSRHFRFTDEGITNEIIESRRKSAYFIPVPRSKKKSQSGTLFDTEWTEDRIEENDFINQIRSQVSLWKAQGRPGITRITSRLLDYWTRSDRDARLFFCQLEALETIIFITEAASKQGLRWLETRLREENEKSNPLLSRIAFKMATGSGKTVVMAMLIAWQALNKFANPQDARFSDSFLIVTPGITIRDRLRVLLPNDPGNYYRKHDVLSSDLLQELSKAKIIITNFHQMKPRERIAAGRLTKAILAGDGPSPFTETLDQMVRRVCRGLGNKKNIVVINDEAHHCYRRRPDEDDGPHLKGEERREAEKRDEEARVWISGLEAIRKKIGIRSIFDLSATPFFLRGSGFSEGTLFPWVVSDFSLIDAIESGIVKVPRVPVSDDSMTGEMPTYRNLWSRIRDELPKKGRGAQEYLGEPKLPTELEGALHSLYGNYEKYYRQWENNEEAREKGQTPPVFIVVCNNTNVSKMIYDYVAGWEKKINEDSSIVVPGNLPIFSNEENGGWTSRPNTILIDSEQLESGEGMSLEFKKIAASEIDEFKNEYRQRFPDRDVEKLTDEDILREVMNTVGKPGKLGENIKCVVSVSMLTEGWDANTVTHILGVRAFGTQLLCEQVVGRGLRRRSYAVNPEGKFEPEYAEVYGVPFSFIPCSGSSPDPRPGPFPTRVRALDDRIEHIIRFPRVVGYKYELPAESVNACFTDGSKMALSTKELPTKVQVDPIVGESTIHTLDDLKKRRENEVAFFLTKRLLDKYFRDDDGAEKPWLFPKLLPIVKQWMKEQLVCKDNAFPQMLLLSEFSYEAAGKIYHAVVRAEAGEKHLKPLLHPYEPEGSTLHVDFDTVRPVFSTSPDRCHVSHVVADTESWEQKLAQSLEDMEEIHSYVKNHNIGFAIPYTFNGQEKSYYPDFIARIDDGHGPDDLLNLIIEVTGEDKKDKAAKVETAKTLWIPAINNHCGFGRWAFLEIKDPWNSKNEIRKLFCR